MRAIPDEVMERLMHERYQIELDKPGNLQGAFTVRTEVGKVEGFTDAEFAGWMARFTRDAAFATLAMEWMIDHRKRV